MREHAKVKRLKDKKRVQKMVRKESAAHLVTDMDTVSIKTSWPAKANLLMCERCQIQSQSEHFTLMQAGRHVLVKL
jgi:hypothetical protein